MPLTRIEIPAGRPAAYRAGVAQAVQEALHAALGVPMEERFQVVTEHAPGWLIVDPGYLGVERSPEAVVVQVYLNAGRATPRRSAASTGRSLSACGLAPASAARTWWSTSSR